MAVRRDFDVGILMSTDTDLKPALEAVAELTNTQARAPRLQPGARLVSTTEGSPSVPATFTAIGSVRMSTTG